MILFSHVDGAAEGFIMDGILGMLGSTCRIDLISRRRRPNLVEMQTF